MVLQSSAAARRWSHPAVTKAFPKQLDPMMLSQAFVCLWIIPPGRNADPRCQSLPGELCRWGEHVEGSPAAAPALVCFERGLEQLPQPPQPWGAGGSLQQEHQPCRRLSDAAQLHQPRAWMLPWGMLAPVLPRDLLRGQGSLALCPQRSHTS